MTSDLLALSRAEQESAKSLLKWRFRTHGLTLAAGALSLAVVEPWVYVAAVGALASEACAWGCRHVASERHELAEEARRRAVLIRELGTDPDALDTARILAMFSEQARSNAEQWADEAYFASADGVGVGRLRESLQESAFWSARLYQAARRRWQRSLGVVVFEQRAGEDFHRGSRPGAGRSNRSAESPTFIADFYGNSITRPRLQGQAAM